MSLDFEDHPFEVQRWDRPCALCGATDSFLDVFSVGADGSLTLERSINLGLIGAASMAIGGFHLPGDGSAARLP